MRESYNIIRVQLAKRDQGAFPNCPTETVTGLHCQGKLKKKSFKNEQVNNINPGST